MGKKIVWICEHCGKKSEVNDSPEPNSESKPISGFCISKCRIHKPVKYEL